MKPFVPRLALVSIALLCGLLITESGLRLVANPHSRIWRPGLDRTLHPDPNHLVGVYGPARFVVGPHGLRAGPLPESPGLTVVALGGSTTECVYLNTNEAWPALIEARLATSGVGMVWVGNGGKSGLSIRHHVVQVQAVIDQFPSLEALVLLVGANDFLRYVSGKSEALDWRGDPRAAVGVHYESFEVPHRPRIGPLYERTEWVRVLRLARRQLQRWLEPAIYLEITEDGRSYATWRRIRAAATEVVETLPSLAPALAAFESDLKYIADITAERDVTLVLLTQPTLWASDLTPRHAGLLWMGQIGNAREEGQGRFYSTSALAEGMAAFNDVTRQVCKEYRLSCVDLAGRLPGSTSTFYDDMHFNENGARQVADLVTPVLAAALELPRNPSVR
jgi:lysophospholipase L1-like esterase